MRTSRPCCDAWIKEQWAGTISFMAGETQRRLAAIVSADVVGYSRLMSANEVDTHARLRSRFSGLIGPMIAAHGGRVVKLMGDGLLAEFPSIIDAVRWAAEAQTKVAGLDDGYPEDQRIIYRVGINLGDVIVDGEDIFGDGVNLADRLQDMAEPGGICISDKVHAEISGKLATEFVDGGLRTAKNIETPIHVWHWSPDNAQGVRTGTSKSGPSHSDKPSIAVLPFNNFSADTEQEFFADGIVEDLITALSRFPWLFVVARNSTFSYKGKNVPIMQVANDLGVRYVVEGSVRSSKTRLRVSVQLIEAASGHHIWAENYDRPVGELFDLQDEITRSITGVLIPALSAAERERSLRDTRPDLDAWQEFQKGLAYFYRPYSDAEHARARELFDRSVELDPGFADAHAMIALMGIYALDSGQHSYNATLDEILAEAEQAARMAVQCDDGNALAHMVLGRVYGLKGNFEAGIPESEIAVRLNPNLAMAHYEMGFNLNRAERYDEAIECFDRAITLSPNDPSRWNFYLVKGFALYGLDRFEDSIVCYKEAARMRPAAFWPLALLAGSLSALDRLEEARGVLSNALERKPDLAEFLATRAKKSKEKGQIVPYHIRRLRKDLIKAGLPE